MKKLIALCLLLLTLLCCPSVLINQCSLRIGESK